MGGGGGIVSDVEDGGSEHGFPSTGASPGGDCLFASSTSVARTERAGSGGSSGFQDCSDSERAVLGLPPPGLSGCSGSRGFHEDESGSIDDGIRESCTALTTIIYGNRIVFGGPGASMSASVSGLRGG